MNILKVGDTKKAACNKCESFETIRFELRDVPFSDASGVVKNVLVGVCSKCDSVAVLPHQSMPVVKKQLEVQRKALESRVPAHIIDILNLASYELSGNTDFVPNLMKYYIHALAESSISMKGFSKYLSSDLFKGKAQKRLSIKGRMVMDDVNVLKEITHIEKTSDLLKGIVLKINDDVLVKKNYKTIHELKNIVSASV